MDKALASIALKKLRNHPLNIRVWCTLQSILNNNHISDGNLMYTTLYLHKLGLFKIPKSLVEMDALDASPTLSDALENQMDGVLTDLSEEIALTLEASRSLSPLLVSTILTNLFNDYQARFNQVIKLAEAFIMLGVAEGMNQLGTTLINPIQLSDLESLATRLETEDATTLFISMRNLLTSDINRLVGEGKSPREIAEYIRSNGFVFNKTDKNGNDRAAYWARYLAAKRYEFGKLEAISRYAVESGDQILKFWRSVRDERVRLRHRQYDNGTGIPIDQPFPNGDLVAGLEPGCRCFTAYRIA